MQWVLNCLEHSLLYLAKPSVDPLCRFEHGTITVLLLSSREADQVSSPAGFEDHSVCSDAL